MCDPRIESHPNSGDELLRDILEEIRRPARLVENNYEIFRACYNKLLNMTHTMSVPDIEALKIETRTAIRSLEEALQQYREALNKLTWTNVVGTIVAAGHLKSKAETMAASFLLGRENHYSGWKVIFDDSNRKYSALIHAVNE